MIITHIDGSIDDLPYAYLNIFPDQFKSEEEKQKPQWVKQTMDYFANVAYAQYKHSRETFVKNYDLLNGIITAADFYQEPEVKDFVDTLLNNSELPDYVRHYPIINPPINTMIGELSKRPDVHKVRAFDDNSKSEQLQYNTELIQKYILQEAKKVIINKLAMKGEDISALSEEDLSNLTFESVKESMAEYTSIAERWANNILTALKMEFNLKELSEDAFRDLLSSSREYFHIFEDNSKLGFSVEVFNPKNVWKLGTPDAKYTSKASSHQDAPYAIGAVHVMEISEIIQKFPDLSEDEIKHLREVHQDYGLINARPSNTFKQEAGPDSIKYDTYNRLILQERMMVESEMKENKDELRDWLGLSNNTSAFGYKYTVVRAYWYSKKKIGKLTYLTEDGIPETVAVDESYKEGSPNEISIEWFWDNQMYYGDRIGPDIFHVKPFNLLDYSPIIGVIDGIKNSTPKSMVDKMKPFQALYNICMNQLYELLEKEIGNVGRVSIRRIPKPKDGDNQDAIAIWEEEARKRGIMFDDDSPENTKAPVSNQSVAGNIDLTRTSEIQSRYNLAIQIKSECWELVGMNRQRLGSTTATETATANQNALVQSFAQTEPLFATHQYVLNQFYQAILDAAQYVEVQKPNSTISYINSLGDNSFVHVTPEDIKLKDLKVFVTSRPEDQQLINDFRQLSQAMIQNGASIYDISVLFSTNSLREMQKMFKDLKVQQDQRYQQEQQLKQQELEQKAKESQDLLAQNEQHHQEDLQLEMYKTDTSNNTKITVAEIGNYFKAPGTDADGNGIPDPLDIAAHSLKIDEVIAKRDLENKKVSLQMNKLLEDKRKNKVNEEIAKEKIANEKARTKVMSKNKTKNG